MRKVRSGAGDSHTLFRAISHSLVAKPCQTSAHGTGSSSRSFAFLRGCSFFVTREQGRLEIPWRGKYPGFSLTPAAIPCEPAPHATFFTSPSFSNSPRNRGAFFSVSGVRGSRISPPIMPIIASAAFTGIGFVSQNSASTSPKVW